MKTATIFYTLTLGAALIITSGCKHRPLDPLSIPGHTRVGTGNQGEDINSKPFNVEPTNPTVSDVDLGNGTRQTDTDPWTVANAGPHDTNREIFAKDTVYFDTDSSEIKPSESSKLENIATYLKGSPKDVLTIEGYCDERGTEGYNLALGDRRSLSVREYLIKLGVESGRMHTVSFGEANPADAGHNESAWKKNRRGISVLISPK